MHRTREEADCLVYFLLENLKTARKWCVFDEVPLATRIVKRQVTGTVKSRMKILHLKWYFHPLHLKNRTAIKGEF